MANGIPDPWSTAAQAPSSPLYAAQGAATSGMGFQDLLNRLKGAGTKGLEVGRQAAGAATTPLGTRAIGLAAPVAAGTGSLMQGDIAKGTGELIGGGLGYKLAGGLASAAQTAMPGLRGKIAGAGIRALGGILGGGIGGGVAGGAAQAAQDLVGGVERRQMGAGESPTGVIPGITSKGIEGLTMNEIQQLAMLQPKIAEQLVPTYNRMRDADMSRQMQLNQQMGQLTGALNQQRFMAELAGGAQSEAGATTRSILTAANPYAASAFQYRI